MTRLILRHCFDMLRGDGGAVPWPVELSAWRQLAIIGGMLVLAALVPLYGPGGMMIVRAIWRAWS